MKQKLCRICSMKLNNKAFTLIELLVVVLIIGVLAAIAVPQYQVAVMKSRLATTISGVKTLAQAAETYYMANGQYPNDDATELDVSEFSGCTTGGVGGQINCKKIKYDLNSGPNYKASADNVTGLVYVNGKYSLSYMQFLEHPSRAAHLAGLRICNAYDNSALSHKVCKSMGGVKINNTQYTLP